MQKHIDSYKKKGFVPVAVNGSGIGAEVYIDHGQNKVVKFGQDSAYDVFVRYALSAPCPDFPCFFHHDTPAGPFRINSNEPYTVTEMEVLEPLTAHESHALVAWF
ncbi:hypothetical protein GJQ57_08730 [Ralstonia pickettii]|uniref:Uncharacterized protein n=1 Tax=Ralstonia pickettii TaxID=329 RepID=A0A7X2HLI9_RALPI|nr:hypothetical protein [Ralstonia pickettii]MRS98740.1 hypothetical protein [Ralstonia pickettii]